MESYDMVIIGAGPAGLCAALYAARYKMKAVVIGQEPGGTVNEAAFMENWLGTKKIAGIELMRNCIEHVKSYGVKMMEETVIDARKTKDGFAVRTAKGQYDGKTLLLAMGLKRRQLDVEGADRFVGKGISYCFTCDAPLFRDAVVGVVGGNDSAAQGALLLSEYAKKVYVIYRGEPMRCEPVLLDKIRANGKIETIYNANVRKIFGEKMLQKAELDNGRTIDVEGLFIEIGSVPSGAISQQLGVAMDEKGYVKVNANCETNVPGVYCAGDLTDGPLKQMVSAAAQGATAAFCAFRLLKSAKK